MKIGELVQIVEKVYPHESMYDFDNSGCNVVDKNETISNILVTLDINLRAISLAVANKCNLIVSHHPLTFNPIKNLNDEVNSKIIKSLIKNNINAYSVHTNFDTNEKYGMGKLFVDTLFAKSECSNSGYVETRIIDGKKYVLGNIVSIKAKLKFVDILTKFKKKFAVDDSKLSYYDVSDGKNIKKLIVIPGSGAGEVDAIINQKPDILITSDLRHNQIQDLVESDISYINGTHYGTEKIFIDYMAKFLKAKIGVPIYKFYDIRL